MKRVTKYAALAFVLACAAPLAAHAALININTASQAELDTLKGIGPVYAARVIAYRNGNGPFKSIEDIQEVKGIGPATFAGIRDLITVKVQAAPATKPAAKPARAPAPAAVPAAIADTAAPAREAARAAPPGQFAAAVAEGAPSSFPWGASALGLAGLIGLGAVGVWYARPRAPAAQEEKATDLADEFDIE